MAFTHIIFGILILQVYVNAAPKANDNSKFEEMSKTSENGPKLDAEDSSIDAKQNDESSAQSVRQKRFYDHFGYGYPPVVPPFGPSIYPRDDPFDSRLYERDDTLNEIHRRLQEISYDIRQPAPPAQPPTSPNRFPIYLPVIYVPQYCACAPTNKGQPDKKKPGNTTPTLTTVKPETSTPDIGNRMDKKNETDSYDYEYYDNNRPISFDPLIPDTPVDSPPVEHGSSQAGLPDKITTTAAPRVEDISTTRRPNIIVGQAPGNSFSPVASKNEAPSVCDRAVLYCCHQSIVTYNCFTLQGCPSATSTPCNVDIILKVIYKFQNYYNSRNG